MENRNPDSHPLKEDAIYMFNHIFLPPKLPQKNDSSTERDVALGGFCHRAALDFGPLLAQEHRLQWAAVTTMLEMLLQSTATLDQSALQQKILGLREGEFLALRIRAQNAAVIVRRRNYAMIFESFEVQPLPEAVMQAKGKLLCTYPGPAVKVPLEVAHDPSFVKELASFLAQMDVDELPGAQAITVKANSRVVESRSTAHPRYITQLLSMILLGMGDEADVKRITKHFADEVCWSNAQNPWRRSPLWLVIRVAIQTTVDRDVYKQFVIFLQMKLLHLFLHYDLSSELLHISMTKISRCVYKLGSAAASFLLEPMKDLCEETRARMQTRWSKEQEKQACSPSYIPVPSDFEQHTILSLNDSRGYLQEVMSLKSYPDVSSQFKPSHHARLHGMSDFHQLCPSVLTDAVKADPYLALFDFESMIEEKLDGWVASNLYDVSACQTLQSCLEQYTDAAKEHYSSYPEDESLMILSIMELWVALDTIAVEQCPLLAKYSPEIPTTFLNPLLLRKSKFIERAAKIEVYLRRRHAERDMSLPSVYADDWSANSFGVNYFRGSQELRAIKVSIEQHARRLRKQKQEELLRMNAKQAELIRDSERLEHLDYWGHRLYPRGCTRCLREEEAASIYVDVHEWPLPERQLEAEAVIFELNCPPIFAIWRNWTYHALRDIGMHSITGGSEFQANQELYRYSPLSDFSSLRSSSRLTLASQAKSFLVAHYRTVKIPAMESQVCVNNGLQFRLYDSERRELARSVFCVDLEGYSTLKIPHGQDQPQYRGLQYAVTHTDHTHNSTIVNQGDCSLDLGLHEQLAFSNLRCGARLQWLNILRELRSNILTFSHEEVHSLIMQAAWQIGKLDIDGTAREWHVELEAPIFGCLLVQECMDVLSHIEGNWMEATTVKTIIYLISRLLISTREPAVQLEAYKFMRRARKVTLRWMREILDKLQAVLDDDSDQVQEYQRRACAVAAICRATFDVDHNHLHALFFTEEDVAILVECSVCVHDNMPSRLGDASTDLQRLLRRDNRLSYVLEEQAMKYVGTEAFQNGLDAAVQRFWSSYCRGPNTWEPLAQHSSRWLMCSTPFIDGLRAQQVHYNMLDGTLLIDGRSLGRLTREIMGHALYRRLFGQKILEVVPTNMPGMDYATRSLVYGYTVFFALRGESLLIFIRAKSSDQTLRLIPHDILDNDFPKLLTMEYVHWMNIATGIIEFRPLGRPLEQSEPGENLHVKYSESGPSRCFLDGSGDRSLVDIRSPTFRATIARLRPLESSRYIKIVYDSTLAAGNISIELPRFCLSFVLNDGEIESKNMQGMVVDRNQGTGTMIGLQSQLVLRHKDSISASLPRSRTVIIPFGDIRTSLMEPDIHVQVHIDTETIFKRQVQWYKYYVDEDLETLAGDANLAARFFRIYLHAVCSHPLPDPLTRQRGTDFALQELKAAASFSFQMVLDQDVDILRLIKGLTPRRAYYPAHHRTMQTTEWSSVIPALSQHNSFSHAVDAILQYAKSLTIFTARAGLELDPRNELEHFLIDRARRRCSMYYEGSGSFKARIVTIYNARDHPHVEQYDINGIAALRASQSAYEWPHGLTSRIENCSLPDMFKEWTEIKGTAIGISLRYTKEWLELDLPAHWLGVYNLCRQCPGSSKKFELIFSFASLAYDREQFRPFVPLFLAVASLPESRFTPAPPHTRYAMADGTEPRRDRVESLIISQRRDISLTPCSVLPRRANETESSFVHRIQGHYDDITKQKLNQSVAHLMTEPESSSCTPTSPFRDTDDWRWFDVENVMEGMRTYFTSCSHNRDLLSFATVLTRELELSIVELAITERKVNFAFFPSATDERDERDPHDATVTLEGLFSRRSAPDLGLVKYDFEVEHLEFNQRPETQDIEDLISQFQRTCHSTFRQGYAERLESSRLSLQGCHTASAASGYRDRRKRHLDELLGLIRHVLSPLENSALEQILMLAGLWPPIHRRALIRCLGSRSEVHMSAEWLESLTKLAFSFIVYQFSQRLVMYAHRSEVDNFNKELQNASFNTADAVRYPDWLLIQIQGDFITRPVQSEIAHEMLEPSSGCNTVLQLNMGEGKSHVIVPLVASALADSETLVRVVVSKPLAAQMFHLLRERVSGLTDRRVFYLPFSRDVKVDLDHVQHIRNLFEECARVQGVLVAQPEHILSFRLMVLDRLLDSDVPLNQSVQTLQQTQAWLTSVSRDILDESDDLLHVRYQLIYTMGEQQPFDGSPDRWSITQDLLDLVRQCAEDLHADKSFSEGVEFLEGKLEGEFPLIRLLESISSTELVSRIADRVIDQGLNHLAFVGLNPGSSLRDAVSSFIKERNTDRVTYDAVQNSYGNSGHWKGILLLRGLLGHGILIYVLSQQRWRVDYGLDPKRSLLAVPYRAKDMPSPRSEFGHPDVTICLTCLSYYYGGLAFEQVQECFNLLIKLDNPALEYAKWVRRGGRDIPESLKLLIGVNMKDMETFRMVVVPKFQRNQATIDFFLARVVFPREAVEFTSRLGTSGWDLAERKNKVTTGFSGTNDNSDLLPISIVPKDQVKQNATNAQVLGYLLRPENRHYMCTRGSNGQSYSVEKFLDTIGRITPEVRVLLDVGAQMLELTNQDLTKQWLSRTNNEIAAGVYFDDTDHLAVISKDGVVEQLYSSPFYQRLNECIIYLDDAHTRGTDLKLPRDYRAAVTLGPKVTKDRLVQGCMRMRKLGHGQSVIFFAPPEVDKRIRDTQGVGKSGTVEVMDVLSWVMSRTCDDIEEHVPHWIDQGVDYHNRQRVDFATSSSEEDIQSLKEIYLQPAARTLDEMYGLHVESNSLNAARVIPEMRHRLDKLGITQVRHARMQEEQEREVSHELEEQRQIERPPKVEPAVHSLDHGIRLLVQRGDVLTTPDTFFPLMTPFRTSTEMLSPVNPWSQQLLCTRDFMTTTRDKREMRELTSYLRPVQWILSHTRPDGSLLLVVMSPFEVNALLPEIRASKYARLHMYAPRTAQAMKPIDDLKFYCIPPLPEGGIVWPSTPSSLDVRCQLNIWGGQLYLDEYGTYRRLSLLLGISTSEREGYTAVEGDRFVPPQGRVGEMVHACLLDKSPIALLKVLLGLRRKGMSFDMTHMGKILNARLLQPEDFDEELPAV